MLKEFIPVVPCYFLLPSRSIHEYMMYSIQSVFPSLMCMHISLMCQWDMWKFFLIWHFVARETFKIEFVHVEWECCSVFSMALIGVAFNQFIQLCFWIRNLNWTFFWKGNSSKKLKKLKIGANYLYNAIF